MNSAASMICIVLKDLGIGITMPFRVFENSVWFGTYEILDIDQIASQMFPSSSSHSSSGFLRGTIVL